MQTFKLTRLSSDGIGTRSQLSDASGTVICEALELAFHDPKIMGKTRIPAGTYPLGFHTPSKFDSVYAKRVETAGDLYHGMLWIQNVPNFQYVLFHCGNAPSDSEACVLCGERVITASNGYFIPGGESEPAFLDTYGALSAAILDGGAELTVQDQDR